VAFTLTSVVVKFADGCALPFFFSAAFSGRLLARASVDAEDKSAPLPRTAITGGESSPGRERIAGGKKRKEKRKERGKGTMAKRESGASFAGPSSASHLLIRRNRRALAGRSCC
jgi:hypothetical protein